MNKLNNTILDNELRSNAVRRLKAVVGFCEAMMGWAEGHDISSDYNYYKEMKERAEFLLTKVEDYPAKSMPSKQRGLLHHWKQ